MPPVADGLHQHRRNIDCAPPFGPLAFTSMVRSILVFSAALLLSFTALARPAHYMVVHEAADGTLSLTYRRVGEMAEVPQLAPTDAWDGNGSRGERRLAVRLVAGGNVVHETDVAASAELRAEFAADAAGRIDAHHIVPAEHDFVVRVPA